MILIIIKIIRTAISITSAPIPKKATRPVNAPIITPIAKVKIKSNTPNIKSIQHLFLSLFLQFKFICGSI